MPILLQRQSAFSALAKKVALAFVQLGELHPLNHKKLFEKTQKTNKNMENINSNCAANLATRYPDLATYGGVLDTKWASWMLATNLATFSHYV